MLSKPPYDTMSYDFEDMNKHNHRSKFRKVPSLCFAFTNHCVRAELLSNSKSAMLKLIVSIGCSYLTFTGLTFAAVSAAQI